MCRNEKALSNRKPVELALPMPSNFPGDIFKTCFQLQLTYDIKLGSGVQHSNLMFIYLMRQSPKEVSPLA